MRGAALAGALAAAAGSGAVAQEAPATSASGIAAHIVAADYAVPTERYRHHIMGSVPPWAELVLTFSDGSLRRIVLPETSVFEDIAPRLADVDGDGRAEVVVVETHVARGGSLAIYEETGKIAATPHIGRPQRWLAPAGIADFDGDGHVEIGYVDRPHLAQVLRLWRFSDGALTEVGRVDGVTNHRIGEEFITGGLRDCGAGPQMIVASANWRRVMAVGFDGASMTLTDLGNATGPESFAAALDCRATG